MPRATNSGISFSISVVLPLPDHPANPNIFMTAWILSVAIERHRLDQRVNVEPRRKPQLLGGTLRDARTQQCRSHRERDVDDSAHRGANRRDPGAQHVLYADAFRAVERD